MELKGSAVTAEFLFFCTCITITVDENDPAQIANPNDENEAAVYAVSLAIEDRLEWERSQANVEINPC